MYPKVVSSFVLQIWTKWAKKHIYCHLSLEKTEFPKFNSKCLLKKVNQTVKPPATVFDGQTNNMFANNVNILVAKLIEI